MDGAIHWRIVQPMDTVLMVRIRIVLKIRMIVKMRMILKIRMVLRIRLVVRIRMVSDHETNTFGGWHTGSLTFKICLQRRHKMSFE